MEVLRGRQALKTYLKSVKTQSKSDIGLVPTMGFLHEGHLSLLDVLHRHTQHSMVSIFVNPTQFSPQEDFDTYPRDLDRDLNALSKRGCTSVYLPSAQDMYPYENPYLIDPGPMGQRLCGQSRPHFFIGVCSVVMRLFLHTGCQHAVFGEKDYQQWVIIRRMIQEFGLPIHLHVGATGRETDGLAMSSRNKYLSPEERRQAPELFGALRWIQEQWKRGHRDATALLQKARHQFSEPWRIDYLEAVDPNTLSEVTHLDATTRLVGAAYLGSTRLIDNIAINNI